MKAVTLSGSTKGPHKDASEENDFTQDEVAAG